MIMPTILNGLINGNNMPKKTVFELCNGKTKNGETCPLKESCARYSEKINVKVDTYLAWGPYEAHRNRCTFYVKPSDLLKS